MENLLGHTEEIDRPAIRKALEESRERLELNNRLIRLCGNAPLPLDPEYLAFRCHMPQNLMITAMDLADTYIGQEQSAASV